jgi:uncharacterized protein DUF4386
VVPIARTARVAGLLYLVAGLPAIFSLQYVPRVLIVGGDAAATADRIQGSEWLLRLAIVGELISSIAFIFLGMTLYRLFREVDQGRASVMLVLVLISVPISLLSVVGELGALTLLGGADYLSVFGSGQLDALALVLLRLHDYGLLVAQIFWGLWLFPLGLLAFRSGFAPRIIGVLLIFNGIAYVAHSLTAVLWPQHAGLVALVALLPEALGEGSFILWLLTTKAGHKPAEKPGEIGTVGAGRA